ncbi:Predicted dehydrogenase [Pseudomonas cedrina]|uniref:Oxidoreductase n=2 Tax=Pseudomonas cedrina TaxID=651740 RepID=A0A1V2KH36_PSECE|nr:Gfo/Idh/MocA family oxidoreductase [Pseudomonas cedrina]ONH56705.1 hypothetical protein BLL36_04835 [Pseudomonas cedrina subsp. cedrina]SDS15231.1 Predicted dehydrogenase [Pseudomonas cedrina]
MSEQFTCLVVGSGSIAKRHISNIKMLFASVRVGCVSASGRTLSIDEVGCDIIYSSIDAALQDKLLFAIIASPAPWHVEHAARLVCAKVPVLIEKPVSDSLQRLSAYRDVLTNNLDRIEIAYNLRFMSSAIRFKALLEEAAVGEVRSVAVDVGQFLPDWRPASDYRKNVSARHELGGGVLLELSHELDYLGWLFGSFKTVYCVTRHTGDLEIDVEDSVDALLVRDDHLVVNVHMDFLQRAPVRICKVVGQLGTLYWDILNNSIILHTDRNQRQVLFESPDYDRNNMYLDQLRHFAIVAAGLAAPAIGLKDGLAALRLIEAMKMSASTGQVVNIGDIQA